MSFWVRILRRNDEVAGFCPPAAAAADDEAMAAAAAGGVTSCGRLCDIGICVRFGKEEREERASDPSLVGGPSRRFPREPRPSPAAGSRWLNHVTTQGAQPS